MDGNSQEEQEAFETLVVSDQEGPDKYVGFFEDDGDTGYLYVLDKELDQIVNHVQIYNVSTLPIREEDVRVVWSADGTKCGVIIWGGMRGIIDLGGNREGRSKVHHRHSPPITDLEWLRGFEHVLKEPEIES